MNFPWVLGQLSFPQRAFLDFKETFPIVDSRLHSTKNTRKSSLNMAKLKHGPIFWLIKYESRSRYFSPHLNFISTMAQPNDISFKLRATGGW